MIFHVKKNIVSMNDYFTRSIIELILFLNRLLTFVETRYWSIKLKIVDFVWVFKKIKHMIEFSTKIILYTNHDVISMKIVIYIDHVVIINIIKQFNFTISSTNKLNLRLVRVSKFFNKFDLNIRHKLEKKHVIFDVFSRLINVNHETHFKHDDELDVLHVHQITIFLINFNNEFRIKILDDY